MLHFQYFYYGKEVAMYYECGLFTQCLHFTLLLHHKYLFCKNFDFQVSFQKKKHFIRKKITAFHWNTLKQNKLEKTSVPICPSYEQFFVFFFCSLLLMPLIRSEASHLETEQEHVLDGSNRHRQHFLGFTLQTVISRITDAIIWN